MINLSGKYDDCTIFADTVEDSALLQIQNLIDSFVSQNAHTRIMPDVHAGAGCTIGTTMHITDKVCPNLVGVDIGCGVTLYKINPNVELDFIKIDRAVSRFIPAGCAVYQTPIKQYPLNDLYCYQNIIENVPYYMKSIGTLGGGNHFIEIDQDGKGDRYLVVHSGSRNLGKTVAEYYQRLANETCNDPDINKDLKYLSGGLTSEYLYDMMRVQQYATLNRRTIIETISELLPELDLEPFNQCIHNFIGQDKILRKGAISANTNDFVYIPFNMRDGGIMGIVKSGNPDWNFSLPHGSGRILSRAQAKKTIDYEEYKKSMKGIYSSCIVESTLDESPFAYKPATEIINQIIDQLDDVIYIKPIYNFKAK